MDAAGDVALSRAAEPVYGGLSLTAWLKIATVAVLMGALFRFNLYRLWLKTAPVIGEANWQHAIFVPLAGIYYLYINREELLAAGVKPLTPAGFTRRRVLSAAVMLGAGLLVAIVATVGTIPFASVLQSAGYAVAALGLLVALLNWGLGTAVFGILLFAYGIWPGQNDFVKDFGMVVTLFGVVLTLCGWDVMKIAWFPIAFLVCAIPWPGLVYSWVAGPLQQLAAEVAVGVMKLCGVLAAQRGTKIEFVGYHGLRRTLNVAEACAGLRSLMTFISVAAAMAFLSARPLWQKFIVLGSAVPIAIFCNVMRVAGQGLLDYHFGPEWSESFAHKFVGLVMLIPAFFLLLLVGWLLDQIFVEEVEDKYEVAYRKVVARPAAVAAAPATAPAIAAVSAGSASPKPAARPATVPPPAAVVLRKAGRAVQQAQSPTRGATRGHDGGDQ